MEIVRTFGLPEKYTEIIAAILGEDRFSLDKPSDLAKAVMQLSNFYKDNPEAPTPWHQAWARAAYAVYFFPLNYARVSAVIAEGKRTDFFEGLKTWSDFGSGSGTVACAAADAGVLIAAEATMIERAHEAITMHKRLQPGLVRTQFRLSPTEEVLKPANRHLSSFSYSLTELKIIPDFAKNSSGFMIIEPATRDDGRRLLGWRQAFIDDGYNIHAPCTHLASCPLLVQSERDWCHDRIDFAAPAWFLTMEKLLPIKNRTLTSSYLLVKKDPPPIQTANRGRLTGDLMKEKGASRQMFCRGENREFLSWQHKLGTPPHFPRGLVVSYPEEIAVKSNELRPGPGDIQPVK